MKRYHTASGSAYEVDEERKLVRRSTRSQLSKAERVSEEWRPYEDICIALLGGLHIVWGTGRDEHSANAVQVGEGSDESVVRKTVTTRVVSVEDVP